MSQDVELLIKSLFARIQKVPLEAIDMNADLFEVYGVDSLRAVKLLSSLEVELEIELPSEQTAALRTLNDVLRCARGALEVARGGGGTS
jgi:acyl carrier protein